jgi:hypothetical protein
MSKLQFRMLFRQFLFRVVDFELLSSSARGDASKLLGQFASILVYFSALLALFGAFSNPGSLPAAQRLAASWGLELLLISATMLAVGIFAVLSWDSLFPDRRDISLLAPLPIRPRTIFLAKAAAVGASLGVAIAAMHSFASLIWPLLLAPAHSGILGAPRVFAAYWLTMFGAGTFVFCFLLCLQGFAALLPRQTFLRISSALQLCAFCILMTGFFLQPALLTPESLAAPRNQRLLACLPSYWFLGLFQTLNGSNRPETAPLAIRAAIGLVCAIAGAAMAFAFSYFRALRKIAEAPDVTPSPRALRWLPRFGAAPITALVHFAIRTLFRSRQHRLIVCFFLGLGLADVILYVKTPIAEKHLLDVSSAVSWQAVNIPLLVATAVMIFFAVIGARVAFAMPIDIRANWIFRLANTRGLPDCTRANRSALLVLAAAPVWLLSAALLLSLWPVRPAAGHLFLLAFFAAILVELCLLVFHKIPFTCSYLPGKANVYYLFFMYAVLLVPTLDWMAQAEWDALASIRRYAVAALVLLAAFIAVRSVTTARANAYLAEIRFEELEPSVILELGLRQDIQLAAESLRDVDRKGEQTES